MSINSDLARIKRRTDKSNRRYKPVSDDSARDLAILKRDGLTRDRELPGALRRLARRAR